MGHARSAVHRYLQRHGISRLHKSEEASSKRKTFSETEIGYVYIDSAQLRSAEGGPHMFLAIDRLTKFAYVKFHPTAEMATGGAFMRGVVQAFPYQIRRMCAYTPHCGVCWANARLRFSIGVREPEA